MNQCERIMRHLEDYGSITDNEARSEYGISRLASRVYDLKRQGVPIVKEWIISKNRYGEKVKFAIYRIERMCTDGREDSNQPQ